MEDFVSGLPTEDKPATALTEPERHAAADMFIAATEADIRRGGDMAAYIPSKDYITIPFETDFTGMEHFYATALHELSHWTGAKHRLDRDLTGRFKTANCSIMGRYVGYGDRKPLLGLPEYGE